MSTDLTSLLLPLRSAYPKYAPLLDALGALMAQEPAAAVSAIPATPPPAPVAPAAPVFSPAGPITAGRFVHVDGNGAIVNVDFGDPTAPYNALRGYNAAHAYDKPGSFTITVQAPGKSPIVQHVQVLPDTRPTVTLAPTDDLADAISKLHDNTILLLPTGATFDLHAPATIAANGVTLRAVSAAAATPPAPAPRIRRLATPGSYSGLIVSGSNVSIEGLEFDSDKPVAASSDKVGIYAINLRANNLLVRNCTFRNIDDGLHCNPNQTGLLAIDCHFTSELRACAAYLDAMHDIVLLGINAVGSTVEHIVRLEGAHNVLVHGGDMNNHDGKETFAIRMGDCVAVIDNAIRTWARISEGEQATPSIYCPHVLFAGNHFTGSRHGGPWLQINPGSQDIWIDGNSFDVDSQQQSIWVQGPASAIRITGNHQLPLAGTTTCKPLVQTFANPDVQESGTVIGQ